MIRSVCLIRLLTGCLVAGAMLSFTAEVPWAWEAGTKVGFDSNINQSVDDEEADSYVTGYALYRWEPVQASPFTWNATASVEGTAYTDFSDLNYVAATIAPGVIYGPRRTWDVGLYAFLEAKGVDDEDQSALTWGGKVNLNQQWGRDVYTGEYYLFTDSHAEADTYSFTEHAFGAFVGVNWTPWSFGEIAYEFAHGDAFRAVGTEAETRSAEGSGRRRARRRLSKAFGADVIRESVDRHAIGADVGFDLTASVFLLVSYTYSTAKGDLGTSSSHAGSIGIGYEF